MTKEWSLIIKTTAKNLSELESIFMTSDNTAEWHIPKEQIIGIMPIHHELIKEEI